MTEEIPTKQGGSTETALAELLRLFEAREKEKGNETLHGHTEALTGLPNEIRTIIEKRIAEWNEDGVPEEKIAIRLRREIEQTIAAFEDQRFGVPNGSYLRMEMFRLFDGLVSEAANINKVKGVAGMFFDMNGLETVNDLAGHTAGDEYLRRIVNVFTGGRTTAASVS